MRRFILVIALACVLSSTALAGEIHSTSPTPAPQTSSKVVTVIFTILSLVR
jgi:hypothetical protein